MPLHITPVTRYVTLTGRPPVHPEDITATLHGLNGAYRAAHLYARYRSVCIEAGRTPATGNAFGRHLTSLGYQPWKSNATRGWNIDAS